MPQPKKGKGKGKGKGKQKGKQHHGGKGQKGKGAKHHHQHQHQQSAKKHDSNKPKINNTKKAKLNEKQQQELLQTKMIEHIDSMYSEYTKKHQDMRTFFGIFTKHNQLQLRELMKASIPKINDKITDKFLKSTQKDDNRDINQFIYLGDIVIGGFATELLNNNKDCLIRAFCILQYFRNFGFGSRLLVNLIKNGVKRKKLLTISLFINEENKKGIAFFERFGFKTMNQENKNIDKNGIKQNNKKEEKKQEETDNNDDDDKNIKMRLDLRIYRSSIMVLVKKQLKEEAMQQQQQQNDINT